MYNCTDLYCINKHLSECDLIMVICLFFMELSFVLMVVGIAVLDPIDLIVGFITFVLIGCLFHITDTNKYYWLAIKDRIL